MFFPSESKVSLSIFPCRSTTCYLNLISFLDNVQSCLKTYKIKIKNACCLLIILACRCFIMYFYTIQRQLFQVDYFVYSKFSILLQEMYQLHLSLVVLHPSSSIELFSFLVFFFFFFFNTTYRQTVNLIMNPQDTSNWHNYSGRFFPINIKTTTNNFSEISRHLGQI